MTTKTRMCLFFIGEREITKPKNNMQKQSMKDETRNKLQKSASRDQLRKKVLLHSLFFTENVLASFIRNASFHYCFILKRYDQK